MTDACRQQRPGETLDLRLSEFVLRSLARHGGDLDEDSERRSDTSHSTCTATNRSSRGDNQEDEEIGAGAPEDKLEELRRPAGPATTLSMRRHGQGAGVVLFDPKDLDVPLSRTSGGWKRKAFALPLGGPERTDDGLSDREEEEEGEEDDGQDDSDGSQQSVESRRQRRQVIEEICSTEQGYVRDIRTLHDYYIAALEDHKHPIMEDAQIAVFFNNLRQLVMLNSKLLNDLVEIMAERKRQRRRRRKLRRRREMEALDSRQSLGSANVRAAASTPQTAPTPTAASLAAEGIGAVFCRYAPLFKLYGGYARDYQEVAGLLRTYAQDTRLGNFTAFLATCKARSGSSKDFESLLIMPIQRIPRYKLLLERVVKHTPASHPDSAFLLEAVHRVSVAASLINETVRDQENLASVLQAQTQFFAGQLALFTADRRLLKSGKLTKRSTRRPEEVVLHLFNDLLLYSSGVLLTGGYRVRRVVDLKSKAVGVTTHMPESYRTLFDAGQQRLRGDCGFVVTSLEKTFILFASTPSECQEWVAAIADAIADAQAKHADGNTGETPADAAALWVPDAVAGSCTICRSVFKVYFRRHHCRRCGAVVCGNCSGKRSTLFKDSTREERVCNPCYRVLDLVKTVAMHWLGKIVEFRGVLRRNRWNKWSEHYFELRRGVLRQYTLASAPSSTSSSTPAAVPMTPRGSAAASTRCCTDTVELAGAIVVHRADARSHKNRFCFQISTSEYDLEMLELVTTPYEANARNGKHLEEKPPSTPVAVAATSEAHGSSFMVKMSPLKQVVGRFNGAARESLGPAPSSVASEDSSSLSSSRTQLLKASPTGTSTPIASANGRGGGSASSLTDWILCAASYEEELRWSEALQRSADRALSRSRRSRMTESSLIPLLSSFDSVAKLQSALGSANRSSCSGGDARVSMSFAGRVTDVDMMMRFGAFEGGDDESAIVEHRRLQILKELIRSEESYVACLGECICLYVQPLLLRQLEGQKLLRRRQQSKYKKTSLLHNTLGAFSALGGNGSSRKLLTSPSPSSSSLSASSVNQRTFSSSSIASVKTGRKFAISPGGAAAAAASILTGAMSGSATASSSSSSAVGQGDAPSLSKRQQQQQQKQQQRVVVMNADMAIFFSSVDQMCTLNQQLLEQLSRHLEEIRAAALAMASTSHDNQEDDAAPSATSTSTNSEDYRAVHRAGAIFHAYAPLLQLYTSYASRYASALQAIESPQFTNFLRELPAEASVTRLRRYLNMPMERIPRYKMFLQELLAATPPDHIDYTPLQAAIRSVDRVANKIRDISDRRDSSRKLEGISARVGIDLRGRGRFVRDGLLRKVCRSKVQNYYFVLLEDAVVYGRQGGLHKKKFKLIDLWECKVSNDTDAMPGVISAVSNSNSAFCFYSPLKSFILLTDSAEEKEGWTSSISECIARTLRGQTRHPRRASVRSDALLDGDEDENHLGGDSSMLVIKNGWLNVSRGDEGTTRRSRRLWITLTLQTLSFASTFKAAQPDESFAIGDCTAAAMRQNALLQVQVQPHDASASAASPGRARTLVLEAQSLAEREEWVRALSHCIAGSHELPKTLDMRRRSVNQAMLAPIFMFDKVSNVCTICTQTFAVYRPRHHCRLCGSLVCGNCSRKRWTLAYGSSKKASRVCDSCANTSGAFAATAHLQA